MHTIPLTRYNGPRYAKQDHARCQEAQELVEEQQQRISALGEGVITNTEVLALAVRHTSAGVVLRQYKMFGSAACQFERAYKLLLLL